MNDKVEAPKQDQPKRKKRFARTRKWVWRIFKSTAFLVLGYITLIIAGLFPVNRSFVETEDGIEIFVFSGEFHSDIFLPLKTDVADLRSKFDPSHFEHSPDWMTHMAFGWGDRDFYINTPSWSDLKFSTACNALLIPSETVMHVSFSNSPQGHPQVKSVKISKKQFEELLAFINSSFDRDEAGQVKYIPGEAYGMPDAFYRGSGSYHGFRTCNCWVGDALKKTGVKTGWFTPLPKTVYMYFPE